MKHNHLVIVSSPSGGGKSTINKMFVDEFSSYEIVTSFTTREHRQGEKNGREYFFVKKDEFEVRLENNEMLEHAYVHGKYYGTSKVEVERIWQAGKTPILEIDVQGFFAIEKLIAAESQFSSWQTKSIFILPPSFKTLGERLAARKSETEESLKKRLSAAKKEVAESTEYEFHIVNDRLGDAYSNFKKALIDESFEDKNAKAHLLRLCAEL